MRWRSVSYLFAACLPLAAQAYHVETGIGADVYETDWDDSSYFSIDDVRYRGAGVQAQFFLDAVNSLQGSSPLAEAAYLQRVSSITLSAAEADGDFRPDDQRDLDYQAFSSRANIVIEDMIIWDIRASREKYSNNFFSPKQDYRQLHFGIGSYFRETQSLVIAVEANWFEAEKAALYDTRGIVVDYRNVIALGRQSLVVGGGAGLHVGEYERRYGYSTHDVSVNRFELQGFVSYYPLPSLGVTLTLAGNSRIDVHDDAVDTVKTRSQGLLSLGVRYFPVNWLALDMQLAGGALRIAEEDDNTEEDVGASVRAASVGLSFRF